MAKKVDIEAVLNVRSDKGYASVNDSRSRERARERSALEGTLFEETEIEALHAFFFFVFFFWEKIEALQENALGSWVQGNLGKLQHIYDVKYVNQNLKN